ncbi:MAG: alkaline phosphatase family protein [Clostridiales bacterium]|nr:alkaline phosphatase family protein [Clostridiales bacterium]
MKRFILCALAALFLLLCGCGEKAKDAVPDFVGFVPSFMVAGDVDTVFSMNRESAAGFAWTTVQNGGAILPAVLLSDVVAAAVPRAARYDLLLVGTDGLASLIGGGDLEGCYIAYSEQYAWECVNEMHPISSKIKLLREIVVVSDADMLDPRAVGLVDAEGSRRVTAGQLRLGAYQFELSFEGRSEINGRDVTVFTPRRSVPLAPLLREEGMHAIVGRDGAIAYEYSLSAIAFEIGDTTLAYKDMRDVAGIMADAPLFNITDVYTDALRFLEQGERVLIIELDGWGWVMYNRAEQPFLGGLNAARCLAVYPPISPVGLASMLTGELPSVHGIHDRYNRELAVEDIFAKVAAMGKEAAYVEGNTTLIKAFLSPTLSPDLNGENGTDDEVFANAVAAMADMPDLLFVHFHGIDDIATAFGPYAPETMAKIAYIDALVAELAALWQGCIIITSDHGLHETEDGGAHGVFCAEDMLVPYIIVRSGGF